MFKGKEVIGKDIIAFDTGKKIDKVYDLIFDQTQNKVLGLLVDEGGWFSSALVLPLDRVKSIGEDAVVINYKEDIISAEDYPQIKQILERANPLTGTKVMTEEGKDLGKMQDLCFDEKTGSVEGYIVSGGVLADAYNGKSFVPASDTIKIGKDVAFVPASVATILAQQSEGGIKGSLENAGNKVKEATQAGTQQARDKTAGLKERATSDQTKAQFQEGADQLREQAAQMWGSMKEKVTDWKGQANQEIEQRRINNALGKPVDRVILDQQDQPILQVGEIVTHAAIEKARTAQVLDILLSAAQTHLSEASSVPAREKTLTR